MRDSGEAPPRSEPHPTPLRDWALFAGGGVVLALLLDAWTGAFPAAGRLFLASLLIYHLLIVPGRSDDRRFQVRLLEALVLSVLAIPLAEVVRGMTGAGRRALLEVALLLAAAHVVGVTAGRLGRLHPAWLRFGYWPALVFLGAGLPLVIYAVREFFGASSIGGHDGALFRPMITLLDAAR